MSCRPTAFGARQVLIRGVAQLGSALRLGRRGPGFESRLPDQFFARDAGRHFRSSMTLPVIGETIPAATICANVITRTTRSILRPALAGRVILRRSANEGLILRFQRASRFLTRLSQMLSRFLILLGARPFPGRPSGHSRSRLVMRQSGPGVGAVGRRRRARRSRLWTASEFAPEILSLTQTLSRWEGGNYDPNRRSSTETRDWTHAT